MGCLPDQYEVRVAHELQQRIVLRHAVLHGYGLGAYGHRIRHFFRTRHGGSRLRGGAKEVADLFV